MPTKDEFSLLAAGGADMIACPWDVRFAPESGHSLVIPSSVVEQITPPLRTFTVDSLRSIVPI
jgi:hypothetical protein